VTPPPENATRPWPKALLGSLALLVLLGTAAFVTGASGPEAQRAWQIYLVNYLFWTGVAVAGVILVGIWHVTNSIWGKVFQGVALTGVGFFPLALVLFLPLTLAGATLFPWVHESPAHRAAWMNPGFVFTRNAVGLLVLLLLGAAVAYWRLRPVAGARWEQGGGPAPAYLRGWQGLEAEQARAQHWLSILSPTLFILFALAFSLLAFDLVQPLDEHFYSTLLGGYFFFSALYAGLAWLALLSVLFFRAGPARAALAPRHLHPIGKLMFGFCMFHGMLFFSQYLPIWYGNLPHEIEFVIVRSAQPPWPVLSVAFLFSTLLLPFVILLSRPVKTHPETLAGVAVLILAGMWLDRFLLIVPSLWHEHHLPFGWLEAVITAGFAALTLLSAWVFNRVFPVLHYDPAHLPTRHH